MDEAEQARRWQNAKEKRQAAQLCMIIDFMAKVPRVATMLVIRRCGLLLAIRLAVYGGMAD